jgi:hypothetical protein
MKALISPSEKFELSWVSSWSFETDEWKPVRSILDECQRVAEVSSTPFEVALPLHWVDCHDECVADQWYFKDGELHAKPQDVAKPE